MSGILTERHSMRFLFAVIDHQTNSGTPEETIAIDQFNDRIETAGQRVIAAGLVAPSEARVVDNRGGRGATSVGPVVQSPEYMSGFWIIDAQSEEVAMELALEASRSCNRRIEVRRFLG